MPLKHDLTPLIALACRCEASATKPGNVHPHARFADLTYDDFVKSADLIAPILARAANLGVGQAILSAVQITMNEIGNNTNLGIALLLGPLAAVPPTKSLSAGIPDVLNDLTLEDAELVYQAIQLAKPTGMGHVASQDISQQPSETLLQIMQRAQQRDAIAAEYASNYETVLAFGYPFLDDRLTEHNWEQLSGMPPLSEELNAGIVELHVRLMAYKSDTLIARKCGEQTALHSAQRAAELVEHWDWHHPSFQQKLQQFDRWLREDGHRRNPGTTADLVAASLFAWLRERYSGNDV